jgi:CheY-like chemotaxis protein
MVRGRHDLLIDLARMRPRIRGQWTSPPAKPRARVLVVVEDRLAGKCLAGMLAAEGYNEVRVVRRALSALFLAQQDRPSVIFLDVALSDDAYQLASDLRRQAGRDSPRLIALASSIEHSTREQARDAGFDRWLVTPVAQNELNNLMGTKDAAH